ncbi:hypothetical protein [Shewanella sp. KT0246]|uniref:hypothetical protein n=1 Tax=Shewanella sp. KT0246 TaxID=2815912 RepID=UPI001BBB1C5C|nr:hypothetical protein [Shewanella sp. KT0246]GIU52806.1 hypothetical protein TUM4249_24770 [Shewanella sp. KT0246]
MGFVTSKEKLGIKPLSITQLEQRPHHFIKLLLTIVNRSSKSTQTICANDITSADAMKYRDELLTQGRSYKGNKDYLAAVFQFLSVAS